jgi:cytochrome c556
MASLVNHAADPIWVAAWRNPQTESEWRELEHLAKQLEIGGALLSVPGTGPMDDQWTANAAWRNFSDQLSQAAARAASAARSRDVQLVARSGDEIVEVCEACHLAYKPDTPTMNIYGELSPRP